MRHIRKEKVLFFINKAQLPRTQALRRCEINGMTTVGACAMFLIFEKTVKLWATFKFTTL
jgi:hypothetical protein